MTDKVEITIEVDLAALLGNAQYSVEEQLVDLAAEKLLGYLGLNGEYPVRQKLGETVVAKFEEKMEALARIHVEEALELPAAHSARIGQPPPTVRETITAKLDGFLAEKVDRDGKTHHYGGGQTRLEWIADNVVARAFRDEVRSVVQEEREAIRARLKGQVADVLSETLGRLR